jgi:hypothetical protein
MTLHAAPHVRLERFVHQDPYVDDRSHAVARQLQELSAMGFHGDPRIDMTRRSNQPGYRETARRVSGLLGVARSRAHCGSPRTPLPST